MQNAVMLNGMSPNDEALAQVQRYLDSRLKATGWQVTSYVMHQRAVAPCRGCFGCWVQTPGRCLSLDTEDIIADFVRSDLAIFLSPVTFGGYSSELKKTLDHFIPAILPFFKKIDGELHHRPRYRRYPDLLVVGMQAAANAERADLFRRLVKRNAINMYASRVAVDVLTRKQDEGTLQATIGALLQTVEVV